MFNPANLGKYSDMVPKDLLPNLKWREELLKLTRNDPLAQEQIKKMCEEDPFFWIASVVWTYNPKNLPDIPAEVPFIPYDFQENAMGKLFSAIGRRNIAMEKSRDMGASWICLLVFMYYWQFQRGFTFLVASRTERFVDFGNNPDSLFWKLRFAISNQPGWLRPLWDTRKLNITNLENGNTLDGDSTTENLARGGRRTAVLLDEAAAIPFQDAYNVDSSLHHVTDCLVKNSTPKGADGAYYDTVKDANTEVVTFHWSEHPVKNQGLYKVNEDLTIEIIDTKWHDDNPDYPFRKEAGRWKGLRSPWYDKKCDGATTGAEAAQEMDIDYLGSNYTFFDPVRLEEHCKNFAIPERMQGDLEYSRDRLEPDTFRKVPNGPWLLWLSLEGGKAPRGRKYVVGADVSMGTGASNSAMAVYDSISGEKVARYINSRIPPESFAKVAVAAARFFNNAFLIWEANGPGRAFGIKVQEHGYHNIYLKTDDSSLRKKQSLFPGWYSTNDTKRTLLTNYREALSEANVMNREKNAVMECRKYLVLGDAIEHSNAINIDDPTSKGKNHGDIVIADALAVLGIQSKKGNKAKHAVDYPVGSFGWRRQQSMKKPKRTTTSWF